jgi:hypothetical protein
MRSRLSKAFQVCAAAAATAAAVLIWGASPASASVVPITPGDLLIYQVGDGAGPLTTNATAVSIVEYSPAGSLVQPAIPVPSSGASALTAVGTGSTEGILTLSNDSKYLVMTGYRKDAGGLSPTSDASTTTPRVVGVMDMNGVMNLTTALTDAFSGGTIRGAASANGSSFYVSGSANAPRYASAAGITTSTPIDSKNGRQVTILDGNLYITNTAGTTRGIAMYTGLPTSATTANFAVTLGTNATPQSYFFADLDSNTPGVDTVYLLDTFSAMLDKYSLVGGTWTANGQVASSANNLAGVVNGNSVTLYVTSGTTLSSFTDSTGYNATIGASSFTTLATAPSNTAFRGLVVTPAPEPGALSLLMLVPLLGRRRRG